MTKLLSVGLMLGGLGFAVQTANAQCNGAAPPATAWQGPTANQPATAQTNPAPPRGQTAQNNSQTYQSFSAEPAPAPAYSYGGGYYGSPYYGGGYGGYGGYYGNPYYGGFYGSQSGYGSYRRWDNANDHGIPPFSYR